MGKLYLSLFGTFEARLDGEPLLDFRSNKVRGLLVYLAVEADQRHTRTRLCGLFWPEEGESTARENLRQTLHQLQGTIKNQLPVRPFLLISSNSLQFNLKALINSTLLSLRTC